MQETGEVKRNGERAEALQDAEAFRRHDGRHQAKHADRRGFHDNDGDFHHRFRGAVKPFGDRFGDLAGHQNADAENDRKENDLEDIARGERLDGIGRHNGQQAFDKPASRGGALGHILHAGHIGAGKRIR